MRVYSDLAWVSSIIFNCCSVSSRPYNKSLSASDYWLKTVGLLARRDAANYVEFVDPSLYYNLSAILLSAKTCFLLNSSLVKPISTSTIVYISTMPILGLQSFMKNSRLSIFIVSPFSTKLMNPPKK